MVLKTASFCSQGCIYLIKNTEKNLKQENVEILLQFKTTIFNCNIHFFSCDQSWIFSFLTPVFSVTWSFRNHSNILICCSIKVFIIIINVENSCAASYLILCFLFFSDSILRVWISMNRECKRTVFIINFLHNNAFIISLCCFVYPISQSYNNNDYNCTCMTRVRVVRTWWNCPTSEQTCLVGGTLTNKKKSAFIWTNRQNKHPKNMFCKKKAWIGCSMVKRKSDNC